MNPGAADRAAVRQAGFTLIELMIGITLGMLILAGLSATFVNSSRTRDEIERASQRIENGRYAMQVLQDDLRMAGYLAEFNVNAAALGTPPAKPVACLTAVADLRAALPLHVQGYDGSSGGALGCLQDYKLGTDVLVVRRVSSCVSGTTDCPVVPGAPYFQASLCNTQLALGSSEWYGLDTVPPGTPPLNRLRRDCGATTPVQYANMRQYLTRIYFVSSSSTVLNDGIPTLKRAEIGAGGIFSVIPIAEGIENLQLEYGIDTNNDGIPDAMNADPDTYPCAGPDCPTKNWRNVMSVKINLLARNLSPSAGYKDTKTYALGLNSDLTPNTVPGSDAPYKRHVFQAEVRLNNPAGRRQ